MRRALLTCMLLALGLSVNAVAPTFAHAFSDPYRFTDEVLIGGGGGRFFTGSPVDGYSCAVCHEGGVRPEVTVIGLPVGGYDAGVTYPVELRWTNPEVPHAANLEFVNLAGLGAGTITLPPPEQIGPTGRCEQSPTGDVATFIMEFTRGRRIVGMSNCGASSLRFNFTAPDVDEIAFAGGVVRTDESSTADGDGVVELTKVLHRRGAQEATTGSTACAISTRARPDSPLSSPLSWGAFTCAVFFSRLVVRRRRRL